MSNKPSKDLESFDNLSVDRDYTIRIEVPEFTCLCPKTGQPDFASFKIEYIPDKSCIELKSLKLYMWSYRQEGAFHEAVSNQILNDLVTAIEPRYLRVTGTFNVRGGLYTSIIVEHRQPNWQAQPMVELPD